MTNLPHWPEPDDPEVRMQEPCTNPFTHFPNQRQRRPTAAELTVSRPTSHRSACTADALIRRLSHAS